MAKNDTYKGTSGPDIVNQTKDKKFDYFNIITYGGADEISLRLTGTWVDAGQDDDIVKSRIEGRNDIALGDGNDTYTGNGFSSRGFDQVFGGAGNDTMTFFTRQSEYHGDGGNDFMSSAGYWNIMWGGDGRDTISYMAQDDDSHISGWGVDLDLGREFARTGQGRKERIFDFENAEGTSYGDGILGSKGNNQLWGMNGRDELDGFKGDDQLFGGNGYDWLYGGNGADQLTGGKGSDEMWGNAGNDHFIFTNVNETGMGDGADEIKDFESGDKIDLSAAGSFTFIGSANFSNTAGELRFDNGVLSGDVDGDGTADFQIKVKDVNAMQNSDFIL